MINLKETLSPLVSFRAASYENVGGGLFGSLFSGAITKNGTSVNNNSALTLSAFFNAVDIISNDYAKLPKAVYQKTPEGRKKLSNHPVQKLISIAPNQYQMSFMFEKVMLLDAILKGDGYAYIERNSATGQPIALQYIDQSKTPVEVSKSQNKLWYKFAGKTVISDDMYHIPGFSLNGITGVGIVTFAAHSLGIAISSQEFGSDYYSTKGIGTAVITASKSMNPETKKAYGDAVGSTLDRSGNWKVAVVDEAGSFNHLKITPQEAEFLATNKAGVAEVARWLNIPLHKLKLLDNVNNSITEHLELGYLSDSVVPWMLKSEQEGTRKLFSPAELASSHYIKANEGALLRSDKATQAEYFSKLIYAGVYTRNEVRDLLDKNKLDGLDEPLTPVNVQLMEQIELQLKLLKTQKNE